MNDPAKIHLSPLEMELVKNKEWILIKQLIIEKVACLFGQLHTSYRLMIEHEKQALPLVFQRPGGKISRGENYKGLPYLMLDYPAIFNKENIFAIRTMFWWGNFFSISLHLSGENFKKLKDLPSSLLFFQQQNFFVCVNDDAWQHDFHSSNFLDIRQIDETQTQNLFKKDFFKVARKIDLNQWNMAPGFLEKSFKEILRWIKINFPADEKDL